MIFRFLKNYNLKKIRSIAILLCLFVFIPHKGNGQADGTRNLRNFDNHAYEVINVPMSWGDATEFASKKGGALAKIETFQEHTFLRFLTKDIKTTAADGGGAKYFWLGGTDAQVEGSWNWTDDTKINPLSITAKDLWGNGKGFETGLSEPDNFMDNQHCLAMGLESWPAGATDAEAFGSAGQWNDISCSNRLDFVIEYDIGASFEDDTLNVRHFSAGDKNYRASFQLSPCATVCLKLISASETDLPASPLASNFSESVLSIKKLTFGDQMYELDLKLIDSQSLIFEVTGSSLTSSTLTYPTSNWITAKPETVGIDMNKLQKAIDYAFDDVIIDGVPTAQFTQGLVIVRQGVIIAERYGTDADKESIATSWSTAKSFTSALAGIAIENGSISSVDTPASEFITEWQVGETKDITIRNLLMMSSGLQEFDNDAITMYVGTQNEEGAYEIVDNVKYSIENRQADPDLAPWLGASYNWNYQNADTQIVGESIERATGKSLASFAEKELFSKIGMSAGWWQDGFGNYMPWCCIDATTRDFARFGLLYAREGKWQGSAVVPAAWVTESTELSTITSPALKVGYGYFWWPHVDGEWFYAAGSRSNNIYIHPGLDLIVARNSTLEFLGDESAKDRATGAHRTLFPAKWDHEEFFELVIDSVNQ